LFLHVPRGSLALSAIDSGAFSAFLLRRVTLEDVARITADQMAELARFVAQVNPDSPAAAAFDAGVAGCLAAFRTPLRHVSLASSTGTLPDRSGYLTKVLLSEKVQVRLCSSPAPYATPIWGAWESPLHLPAYVRVHLRLLGIGRHSAAHPASVSQQFRFHVSCQVPLAG
jgi:hypothetical protein